MRQGTTPTCLVIVDGYDLTTDMTVFVSLKGKVLITKTGDELSISYAKNSSAIAFRLSQEETFSLGIGTVYIQVRFIDSNNIAKATDIVELNNLDVLMTDVIEYGGE